VRAPSRRSGGSESSRAACRGADAGARELDHRPDQVLDVALLVGRLDRELSEPPQLLLEADERVHDLDERRVAGSLVHRRRGADDRPHLHLVDLGVEQPEPHAARAEHRVRLRQRVDPLERVLELRQLLGPRPSRQPLPRFELPSSLRARISKSA
jgi:hypothetical protein